MIVFEYYISATRYGKLPSMSTVPAYSLIKRMAILPKGTSGFPAMSFMKKNFYLGIDLGTTNTRLAWGHIDTSGRIEPKVLKINMMTAGGKKKEPLLPSYVYFKKGETPIVGEYAKSMIGRQTERVVKSVKNYMGQRKTWDFDGGVYTPEDISALILKHIRSAAKEYLEDLPEDVVITVPASFDTDMRSATIRAAELAGFRTKEDDGRARNILLDEPIAALYDFINRQNKNEFPQVWIDPHVESIIMVFDLGGGTLDISIHKVYSKGDEIVIENLAVSRYTNIGGDKFDELLARHLFDTFKDKHKLSIDSLREKLLQAQFIDFAECAKIELTNKIENAITMGTSQIGNLNNMSVEILRANICDNKGLDITISKQEYDEIISRLLGKKLTLSDARRLRDLTLPEQYNNIVYPILDALDKAKEKLRTTDIPLTDAILLNGGMTQVHSIRERLKELFGNNVKLITAGDPQEAVAKGAVIYHYNLHHGIKPTSILNETIGIEVVGEKVEHIVRAGTILPYTTQIADRFIVASDMATFLDIPFYRGNRNDTQPPNVRIADRRVSFQRTLKKGEPVALQIHIDESNIVSVGGWVQNEPNQRFEVKVNSLSQEEIETDIPEQPAVEDPKEEISKPSYSSPANVSSSISHLKSLFKNYGQTRDDRQKSLLIKNIKHTENMIQSASNGQEFFPALLSAIYETNMFGKERLVILMGNLAEKYPDDPSLAQICETCMRFLQLDRDSNYMNTMGRYTVETIGKTGLSMGESFLSMLLGRGGSFSIKTSILISLGKIAQTVDTVNKLEPFLTCSENGERIAANWAIGKIGSRQKPHPLDIGIFASIISILCKILDSENHFDARVKIIYALGEIGDKRFPSGSCINTEQENRIVSLLEAHKNKLEKSARKRTNVCSLDIKTLSEQQTIKKTIDVSLSMIQGKPLTQEQEKYLLGLRTKLEIK